MSRLSDLVRFYALLDRLKQCLGGTRSLATLNSFRDWPTRGVYFFFEPFEVRKESGDGPRVVRVGTHALTVGSRSTLRQRLIQHRGQSSGLGNHRGSIFRLLVGEALLARGGLPTCSSWGVKGDISQVSTMLNVSRDTLAADEAPVERAVTKYLASMPFLWLDVDDEPGANSQRGVFERNAIALLSNYQRPTIDPPSPGWLGNASNRSLVRGSSVWNQRHVEEAHDPAFLDSLELAVERMAIGVDRF
jgi:hypothetical protein